MTDYTWFEYTFVAIWSATISNLLIRPRIQPKKLTAKFHIYPFRNAASIVLKKIRQKIQYYFN